MREHLSNLLWQQVGNTLWSRVLWTLRTVSSLLKTFSSIVEFLMAAYFVEINIPMRWENASRTQVLVNVSSWSRSKMPLTPQATRCLLLSRFLACWIYEHVFFNVNMSSFKQLRQCWKHFQEFKVAVSRASDKTLISTSRHIQSFGAVQRFYHPFSNKIELCFPLSHLLNFLFREPELFNVYKLN